MGMSFWNNVAPNTFRIVLKSLSRIYKKEIKISNPVPVGLPYLEQKSCHKGKTAGNLMIMIIRCKMLRLTRDGIIYLFE